MCLLRETSAAGRADQRGAGTIGTFGLIVKLGSATFGFLFSTVPKSTKSIGGASPRGGTRAFVGTTSFPSLAELSPLSNRTELFEVNLVEHMETL